jgi:hypothetical protein
MEVFPNRHYETSMYRRRSVGLQTHTEQIRLLLLLSDYKRAFRSLSALAITLTEESAMAAAPMTGDSRMPKAG